MDSLITALPIALLLLACPLMMVGMGVAVWLGARMRGEKKPMSVGCMMGHGNDMSKSASMEAETELRDQVVRMEQEIAELRARVQNDAPPADGEDTTLARR